MKKLTAILLAGAMLFAFAACGKTEEPAGPEVGMPNPMQEMASLEELCEAADCAMIRPEGAEIADEAYFMIEGEPQIAEYRFTADGKQCFLRFARADAETDISGIFGENGTLYAEYPQKGTVNIQNDDLQSQRWFTIDGQYVFTVYDGGEWEWTQFNDLMSQFADMEPRNWSSEVPFADYLALTGYYVDDDMNMAAVSIEDDHAAVYVVIDQEDGTRLFWEMDAVLEEGRLTYEKETISKCVYDEDCNIEETPLPDGGAGFIAITDNGSLDFSGAYSEQLRGFVMAPYSFDD